MAVSNVNNTAPQTTTPAVANKETGKAQKAKTSANANAAYKTAETKTSSPSIKDAAAVKISPEAKKLNDIALAKKVAEQAPDIREEKVAKLKEQIAKGEYQPDAVKIANGIAREALLDEASQNPGILK